MLDQQLVQIPVEAEATNIPRGIDIDVEGMEVGTAVHARDLKLPRGVSLQVDPETLVLHVIARQAEAAEEEEVAEGAAEVPEAVAEQAAPGEGEQAG
jgi:large subunit ribosomal protein L25